MQKFHVLPTQRVCVFHGSQGKERIFSCTELTGWFYNRDEVHLLRVTNCLFKYISGLLLLKCWQGQLCRYSDSLQDGRPLDRIPVRARFSAPVQTGPGTHSASYTMDTEYLSRG